MTTYTPIVVVIIVGLLIVFLLLNWLWDKIATWLDQKKKPKEDSKQ